MNETFSLRGGISSVLYAEGVYYAFGAEKKSLVLFTSTDLIGWKREKEIYHGKKLIGAASAHARNGRIYLLFACGESVMLAISDRIFQEFEIYPCAVIAKGAADFSVCRARDGYRLTAGGDNGIRVWESYNLIDWSYGGASFPALGRTVSPSYLPSGGREYLIFGRDGGAFAYSGGAAVRVEDFPLPRTAALEDGRLILFGEKAGTTLFREIKISDGGVGVYPIAEGLSCRAEKWSLWDLRYQKRGCLPDMPDAPVEYAIKIELAEDAERFRLSLFEGASGGIYFHYNAAEGVAVLDAASGGGEISARKLSGGKVLLFTVRVDKGILEVASGGASFSASLPRSLKGRGMSVTGEGGEISITAFGIKNREE